MPAAFALMRSSISRLRVMMPSGARNSSRKDGAKERYCSNIPASAASFSSAAFRVAIVFCTILSLSAWEAPSMPAASSRRETFPPSWILRCCSVSVIAASSLRLSTEE